MSLLELITLAASAWYLAYILTQLAGPFGLFEKVREWKGGRWHGRIKSDEYVIQNAIGTDNESTKIMGGDIIHNGLFDCIFCTAFWAAIILRLIGTNVVTDALAIAGVALWFHGFTNWWHIGGTK